MAGARVSLRPKLRAITDALPDGQWIRYAGIFAALPEPKPPRAHVTVELRNMVDSKLLKRRGKRRLYEYRSTANPLIDKRTVKKSQAERSFVGHMELGRRRRAAAKLAAETRRRVG